MEKCFEFDEKAMVINLDGHTYEDVLRNLADVLHGAGYVRDTYVEAIIQREHNFPTGLPTGEIGVAIPHTDVCHVVKPMIAVGILKQAVDFANMGGAEDKVPVRVIFMLAMNHCDNQVKLLSQLMQMIQDTALLQAMCGVTTVAELQTLLTGKIWF